VPGAWDSFELAVRAILGQQITVTAATRLAGEIADRWGEAYDGQGLSRVFPSPERLCEAVIGGMPASRAGSIAKLAAAVSANPRLIERAEDLETSIGRLCALPGIGEWTANYIAMRALRETDAFPAADVGLLRALEVGGQRLRPADLIVLSQSWRPWRAYAAMHLWTAPVRKEKSHELAA
jgi:3-methyladenine DNA glycosylase/8-oxoguanine DNA glycosylase